MELCARGQAGFSGVYASGAVTAPLFVTGSILLMAIAKACVGAAYVRSLASRLGIKEDMVLSSSPWMYVHLNKDASRVLTTPLSISLYCCWVHMVASMLMWISLLS